MSEIMKEKYSGALPEPVSLKGTEKIIDQMNNDICRLFNNNRKGTGFSVKIPHKKKLLPVLITNNYVINKDDILNNKIISIYLNNDKILKEIKLDNKRKIYINEKYDITIIEIKENEDKLNNKYLEFDDKIINYFALNKKEELNNLNNIYSKESMYILNYNKNNDIFVSYGNILYLNNTELYYQCNIKQGLSGLPILLANNQKLIGIHYNSSKYKYNKGNILIYLIKEFSKITNNIYLIDKEKKINNNFIIGEFDITEDNLNIRIINSYGEFYRENKSFKYEEEYENELEINKCEIRINDELIPFSYFHKFNKKGKYKIKYAFSSNITKTDYMFNNCSSLINIDLSNLNTNNITNMRAMFSECSSLININLSNINTNNVINMRAMFNGCVSLRNIDLNNFNTNKVINMSWMFRRCSSLTNIDLSNFNTNNVTNMSYMFSGCSSLTKLNLSNFNADNVVHIIFMLWGCKKLTNNNIVVVDDKILKQIKLL